MDFEILGPTRSPDFVILKSVMDCRAIEDQLKTQELNNLGLYRSVAILCNCHGWGFVSCSCSCLSFDPLF